MTRKSIVVNILPAITEGAAGGGNETSRTGKVRREESSRKCSCPSCKRTRTLRLLRTNFKCADIICDFCGYIAQVKTTRVKNVSVIPKRVLGAAWLPQKARMDAGIYFPLFLVLVAEKPRRHAIYYLSADLQTEEMFKPRKPLSSKAKRSGWQGFMYDLEEVSSSIVRLFP